MGEFKYGRMAIATGVALVCAIRSNMMFGGSEVPDEAMTLVVIPGGGFNFLVTLVIFLGLFVLTCRAMVHLFDTPTRPRLGSPYEASQFFAPSASEAGGTVKE